MSFEKLGEIKTKVTSLAFAFMVAAYCTVMTAAPALADGVSEITSGIVGGTQKIWNILVAVVAPIAAVSLAICAVKILWGGQKAAEEAKSTAIRIVIGVALVLLAPSLVKAVKGWFTASEWSF